MFMHRLTVAMAFWILIPAVLGQVAPKAKPSRVLPQTAAVRVTGHLVSVETVTAPSEMAGLIRPPLRCDDAGNIYLRTDSEPQSAIHKLNSKGESIALYQATSSTMKVDVASYFDVDADGRELYELVYPHEINRYVFVYGANGELKSSVKLEPGFPFMPSKLAAFASGQYLVSGLEYDRDKTAAMWPFTGIFAADGRLLKEVALEDDQTLHDMAASGDARVANPGRPGSNRAVSGSEVEIGGDGNAYLMRWTNPAIFYAITPGGEVLRRFTVDTGLPGYEPAAMHVYKNRIAVWLVDMQTGNSIMKIVDLEGHDIATYDESKAGEGKETDGGLGAAFACYIENPTRFLFVGANNENRVQFWIAEVR
jgi:hypothetical protein